MNKKIPTSISTRIEALEKGLSVQRRKPVAMYPKLVSFDEWGELAGQMQAVLKDNIKMDTAPDYGDLPKLELVASR